MRETRKQMEAEIREGNDPDLFASLEEYERFVRLTLADAIRDLEEAEESADEAARAAATWDRIEAQLRQAGFVPSCSTKSEATYWGFGGRACDHERIRVAAHDVAYACSESLVEIGVMCDGGRFVCDVEICIGAEPAVIDESVGRAIELFHRRVAAQRAE